MSVATEMKLVSDYFPLSVSLHVGSQPRPQYQRWRVEQGNWLFTKKGCIVGAFYGISNLITRRKTARSCTRFGFTY